jgi:hypothetical protein
MKDDFEKWAFEEALTSEIASCMIYEAFKKVNDAEAKIEKARPSVFHAFLILGRAKLLLGKRFEELRQELYDTAKEKFLPAGVSEAELRDAMEGGVRVGQWRTLPAYMSSQSIHYGFVAEMVWTEIHGSIRYVEGTGWEEWKDRAWRRLPKERGIIGLIYKAMRQKINDWRDALEEVADVNGTGGWLGELEKNINDPAWLRKVEELFLLTDYFGVVIVSDDDRHS